VRQRSAVIATVKNKDSANMQNMLVEAARIRKFLG
jgi:phosphoenolpyruvate carboxylase